MSPAMRASRSAVRATSTVWKPPRANRRATAPPSPSPTPATSATFVLPAMTPSCAATLMDFVRRLCYTNTSRSRSAMIHDVAICGAGPAGSYAAYLLARQGLDVALIDKAVFPREKPCGGALSRKALELVDFDLQPVVQRRVTGAWLAC